MANGKRISLVSGAEYHNFDESPIFTGIYKGECHGKDEKTGEDKVIGFYFENEDGEEEIITNSFAIEKALNMEIEHGLVKDLGKTLEITFQGKTTIKKTGKPFNRFQVVLID